VKATFDDATADNILVMTDWDTWVYSPGLPPVTLSFQTTELEDAQALGQAYADLGGASSPNNGMAFFDFFSSQKVAFVQELDAIDTVDADLIAYFDSELSLTSILDPMVKNEWFVLGIKDGYEAGRNAYVSLQRLCETHLRSHGESWQLCHCQGQGVVCRLRELLQLVRYRRCEQNACCL
jgi:hypothetical protein